MAYTELLKYVFTEQELKDFARDLARESTAASEAEEQKKAVTAQFAEKIAASKSRISVLARHINSGYEYRNIECRIAFHTPKEGRKTVYRLDAAGDGFVREAEMTPDEKQEKLFAEVEVETKD